MGYLYLFVAILAIIITIFYIKRLPKIVEGLEKRRSIPEEQKFFVTGWNIINYGGVIFVTALILIGVYKVSSELFWYILPIAPLITYFLYINPLRTYGPATHGVIERNFWRGDYSKEQYLRFKKITTIIATILFIVILFIAYSLALTFTQTQIKTQNSVPTSIPTSSTNNETTSWITYTYSSAESGILPDITFKFPSLFGNSPSFISSRSTNRPANISDDWGGFVEFNPTGVFGDRGFRIEFFKRTNPEANFEGYVTKFAVAGGWASPKYFQATDYKIARLRFASYSHYDADVGWYFLELPSGAILVISTSGDKKYLYDDDSSGNSIRDKIISTFTIAQ